MRSRAVRPQSGIALVATLASLIIVAILAVIVLSQTSSSPPLTISPGTTLDASAGNSSRLADQATCEVNFEAVSGALTAYVTLHGANPPAGTAWATARAGGPLLRAWPDGDGYAITWDGRSLMVRPAHGRISVNSDGTSSPASGCLALGR